LVRPDDFFKDKFKNKKKLAKQLSVCLNGPERSQNLAKSTKGAQDETGFFIDKAKKP
jgi:hypothetical protein